jgi:peptide/nickel transport system permease protein
MSTPELSMTDLSIAVESTPKRRFRYTLLGRLLRNWPSAMGILIIGAYLVIAIFSQQLAPFDPLKQDSQARLQEPGAPYLFGTDEFGRDIFSRLMGGATNSFRVAITAVAISGLLGSLIGITGGYFGGIIDNTLMRLMDLIFSFPAILLALAISTALGPGFLNTIIAISIVYLPIFARVARGSTLQLKEMAYVEAARCLGAGHFGNIFQHIVPNALTPIIVQISLALSWAILTESSLSFLGLGTPPPHPSWGGMLSESRAMMELAPWMAFAPGAAIMFAILGFNLLGDGLRDVLDPHQASKDV